MQSLDTLRGGSPQRLRAMRAYRDRWNADKGHIERGTLLAEGMAGILAARSHGAGKMDHGRAAIMGGAFTSHGSRLNWCEDAEAIGLRWIGWADEIAGRAVDHRGWYMRADDGGTVARGCVFALRDRRAAGGWRFIAGFREGTNGRNGWASDSGDDAAVLELSGAGELGDDDGQYMADADGAHDAARAADSIAQRFAEDSREYDTAWQAGARWRDARDEARTLRTEMREVAHAARANITQDPVICRTLREKITGIRAEIAELRDECEKLADGDAPEWRFYTGNAELRGAFNEGAEETVLRV